MEKTRTRMKCPVCGALVTLEEGALELKCKFCGSESTLDGNGNVTGGAFVGKGIGPAAAKTAHKMSETVSYTSDELEDPEFKQQTKHMGSAFKNILAGVAGIAITCVIVLAALSLMTAIGGR